MNHLKINNLKEQSLALHKKYQGKIKINVVKKVQTKDDLSLLYSPGVAYATQAIYENPNNAYDYTCKGRMIAVVTDGSAILGLGNLGPLAALPVMEGKCLLFKEFGDVEAVPICLDTQDTEKIIEACKLIAPTFAGINLEDISAPRCVTIERRLKDELDIPVFHDDQHGTSIVVAAALINVSRLMNIPINEMRIALSGTGAAGSSVARRLKQLGVKTIHAYNLKGVVGYHNYEKYDFLLKELLDTNIIDTFDKEDATLGDIVTGADVFIGLSGPNILTVDMVNKMNRKIIFALANPNPEISYDNAKLANVEIYATGRSDYPNQVNNVLAFPGLFKGAIQAKATKITEEMINSAVIALAHLISAEELTPEYIIPNPFDKRVAKRIAQAVKKQAIIENIIRK